jgi:flagellar hook assembly protein FlgD
VNSPGLQVFPNPFLSDGTSKAYLLASTSSAPPISVVMTIVDLGRNEIRSTKSPALPFQGTWNAIWDGRDDTGKLVQSGEYLYTIHVDGALRVGKIVVVRK